MSYNPSSRLDSAKSQNLQGGLPRRFCESARNDEFLDSSLRLRSTHNDNMGRDSSLRKCSAQNDKIGAKNDKNGVRVAESRLDSADSITSAEPANKSQPTIEAIAVEVVGFLDDFGRKARLKSAQCPKSSKSTQDAPKSKLNAKSRLLSKDA